MRRFFRSYGLYLFGLLAIADLAGIIIHYTPMHQIAKPLLMPALLFTLLFATGKMPGKSLLLAGLFFSFAGDVFLLFDSKYPICFILGLVSFLITHIFYIIYFIRIPSDSVSLLKRKPYLPVIVILYVGGLLLLLIPHLAALTIPVIIYALVLGCMLLAAMDAFYKVNKTAGGSFIAGAGLFVLSDSLLAINKFYHPIPAADFLIMLTYCAAQFLIVMGFLTQATAGK